MKEIFIWVAKFILAVFTIVVISYCLVGLDYLIDSLKDYFNKSSNVLIFDSWKSFKENFISISIISAILFFMDNIKISYNKQPKGIYKLLAKWRKERNITTPNYDVYCANIIEELLEPLFEKKEIKEIQSEIMNKYFIGAYNLDENKIVDTICDIKVFSINELGTMKYNGKKCMKETIKEISSREQGPQQKEEWAKNGANGKWLKSELEEHKALWYKADYSKCKLK